MCINPRVVEEADRDKVDVECRKRTASWVRARKAKGENVELCDFFEQWDAAGTDAAFGDDEEILDCEDMKVFGKKHGYCPYFVARHAITRANVIVYNYQYMLDPKVAHMVSKELERESIVVFDEGHNIDNICIEALSVELDVRKLQRAQRCASILGKKVDDLRAHDAQRVRDEYDKLVKGLQSKGALPITDNQIGGSPFPMVPSEIADDAVPGNVRKAEHFLRLLRIVIQHLKHRIEFQSGENQQQQQAKVEVETPAAFLLDLERRTALEQTPLKFFHTRLSSLIRTVEVADLEDSHALGQVADFASLVAGDDNGGFAIVIDPFFRGPTGIPEPKLQLCCLDASKALKPVLDRFDTVIITSGTLSPLELYSKILGFGQTSSAEQTVVVSKRSFPMSIYRPCILPMVVTKGADQLAVSTRFESREDASVVRNYGALLVELASRVPDGIIAFFTSYQYMENTIATWDETGVLRRILEHKLLFIETKDVMETSIALDNFRRACDHGRGAVFLSIARGKVSEGVDFEKHYGRCIVNIGVPYQYTQSHVLRTRLEFLLTHHGVREADFLTFDAMRQTAQCVGRVIRSKNDYGIVILADARFARKDKKDKLPPWVLQFMKDAHLNLSTDAAMGVLTAFLREMAQPVEADNLNQILIDHKQVQALVNQLPRPSAHSF